MSEIPEGHATLAYWRTLTTRLADDLVTAEAEVERLTDELAGRVCDACNGTGQWVDYPAVSCPKCHARCAPKAEVERLTADISDHWLPMGEALAAEVERLTTENAALVNDVALAKARVSNRDRRILDALAILDPAIRSEWGRYDGGLDMLSRVRNALRGDA